MRHFDMYEAIDALIDEGSFFDIKKLFAAELITGFARIEGQPVGIIANQPKVKGGVLFVDSADKATKFINLCDAFSIPLLFLADVPGFMIGTKVERAGIIRHGAKLIMAMSSATVPKISVIVRKAYGEVFTRWLALHLNQMSALRYRLRNCCNGTRSSSKCCIFE